MQFVDRLRAFEQRLQGNMAEVHCPTHLCLGQEQVPQAIYDHLGENDWVFSTHRAHGHYLAKGGSEQKLWDEIMGLPSGINGGFSGSQSFSDPSVNFHCSAIVGGLIGVATGTAYALKTQPPAVVVCCIGDAGTEAGVFWESLNWAALNSLPICYIVENNGMSVDARIEERQAMPIGQRVAAFGLDIFYTAREAISNARDGFPSFYEQSCKLECDHLNFKLMMPGESHGGI
jgi:pyruvate dehydrogenase E1 component alpha subunit